MSAELESKAVDTKGEKLNEDEAILVKIQNKDRKDAWCIAKTCIQVTAGRSSIFGREAECRRQS